MKVCVVLLLVWCAGTPLAQQKKQPSKEAWQGSWEKYLDVIASDGKVLDDAAAEGKHFAGRLITWEGRLGKVNADPNATSPPRMVPVYLPPRPVTSSKGIKDTADHVQVAVKESDFKKWKDISEGSTIRFHATMTARPIIASFGGDNGMFLVVVSNGELEEVVHSK